MSDCFHITHYSCMLSFSGNDYILTVNYQLRKQSLYDKEMCSCKYTSNVDVFQLLNQPNQPDRFVMFARPLQILLLSLKISIETDFLLMNSMIFYSTNRNDDFIRF